MLKNVKQNFIYQKYQIILCINLNTHYKNKVFFDILFSLFLFIKKLNLKHY